ncbi:MAG: hypothetical protein U9Q06_03210 [Nanoarchaeota archaeon]|nr:hypothetical protein [Nanoarchaeota archaeon]
MENKAQVHVEMILSFVIFVGLVFFLFLVFQPFKQSSNPQLADFVFNKLDNKIAIEMRRVSVGLDVVPPGCFEVSGLVEDLGCGIPGNELVVWYRDLGGIMKKGNAEVVGNNVHVGFSSPSLFYEITCASGLTNSPASGSCSPVSLTLGIIVDKMVWSEQTLIDFKTEYGVYDSLGYKNLKKDISGKDDFGLEIFEAEGDEVLVVFSGGKIELGPDKFPQGLNVYAKVFPVEVLMKTGEVKRYLAKISVW